MLTWIDALIVGAFVLYAVAAGLRARRVASQGLEEYFLAGRSLSGWQAGLSMAATQFAADTPLLVTGLVATAGIFALWQLWIYALAFLLLGFVLAPSWRRAGVLTDAELAELRYGGRAATVLRGVKALYFGTLVNCIVLAWVLFATRAIAEPFLLWNRWLPASFFESVQSLVVWVGVCLAVDPSGADVWIHSTNNLISLGAIVTVTLFYSTTGGLRSVVATDMLQFSLAMLGTAAYMGFVVAHFGGIGELVDQVRQHGVPSGMSASQLLAFTPSQARDASLAVLSVFALQWFIQMNADGSGYLAQRCMACRSDRDARLATVVFSVAQVLLRSLLWLPIALGLLVIFPADAGLVGQALQHDREVSFVRGMVELLPVGVRGLMLTAMLAALASTIDTHLNWGASYWTRDLYERILCQVWLRREPHPRTLVCFWAQAWGRCWCSAGFGGASAPAARSPASRFRSWRRGRFLPPTWATRRVCWRWRSSPRVRVLRCHSSRRNAPSRCGVSSSAPSPPATGPRLRAPWVSTRASPSGACGEAHWPRPPRLCASSACSPVSAPGSAKAPLPPGGRARGPPGLRPSSSRAACWCRCGGGSGLRGNEAACFAVCRPVWFAVR
ncbi:MAG: hypothetical protein JRH16_19300 [Deltaproteobacteria bacterium]|nr:hypothetical protein [Deltaproteobacteria bacterium]